MALLEVHGAAPRPAAPEPIHGSCRSLVSLRSAGPSPMRAWQVPVHPLNASDRYAQLSARGVTPCATFPSRLELLVSIRSRWPKLQFLYHAETGNSVVQCYRLARIVILLVVSPAGLLASHTRQRGNGFTPVGPFPGRSTSPSGESKGSGRRRCRHLERSSARAKSQHWHAYAFSVLSPSARPPESTSV